MSVSKIEVAKAYFERTDAGSPALLDLFTDDVEMYFPKFGVQKGKRAFAELAGELLKTITSIAHPIETITFVHQGDFVAAEGLTHGTTTKGTQWSGGATPGGRFCNMFHFRGDLIDRVHIYLDPDYAGEDTARFLWGPPADRNW